MAASEDGTAAALDATLQRILDDGAPPMCVLIAPRGRAAGVARACAEGAFRDAGPSTEAANGERGARGCAGPPSPVTRSACS